MPKQEWTELVDQIAENVSVEDEAGIFIDKLQDDLTAAITAVDWAQVTAVRDNLKASKAKLVAAFAENIPAPEEGGGTE